MHESKREGDREGGREREGGRGREIGREGGRGRECVCGYRKAKWKGRAVSFALCVCLCVCLCMQFLPRFLSISGCEVLCTELA